MAFATPAAPSAAAAAGAAAAALLQRQKAQDDAPEPTEGGWSEHQTGDGRKFYYQEKTQTSTWEKPDALMSSEDRDNNTNWREYKIWDGRVFYFNKETKVSCWSMPPELRKLRGEGSGIDDRQLPATNSEKRKEFWNLLGTIGVTEEWTWKRANEATSTNPVSAALDERMRKQVFAEYLSLAMRKKQIDGREKERNAATALERLIEERFPGPEDLATTYQEAENILGKEEAWKAVKSDMRREEVFQSVMERLEEKHDKIRADKRVERVVKLQRLMASDPELRRPRLRWSDAAAILARRDELQEEDPPLEALRVWASLRELRPVAEHEAESKARHNDPKAVKEDQATYRQDRKRRDNFVQLLKELAAGGELKESTTWFELEKIIEEETRYTAMQSGPGAGPMELFDEFVEEIRAKGPMAYDGVLPWQKEEKEEQNPAKRARRAGWGAPEPGVVKTKEELLAAAKAAAAEAAAGAAAAAAEEPLEEDDTNALDELIAAAGTKKTEAAAPAGAADGKQDDATGSSSSDEEDDEEDDPLMGIAAKAAAEKAASGKA